MGLPFVIIPDRFRPGLAALVTAYDYARDSQTDTWQFAVDLCDLLSSGATLADVRWLIVRGFAEHARETTIPGDKCRSFRTLPPTYLPVDMCVTLSETGAAALRPLLSGGFESSARCQFEAGESTSELRKEELESSRRDRTSAGPTNRETRQPNLVAASVTGAAAVGDDRSPADVAVVLPPHNVTRTETPLKPVWDPAHRELRYNGLIVKRYRVPAANQAAILDAFQEDGWPEFIDDPISPERGIDPKDRLKVTIKSLNRNQVHHLIRFHGNGNGLQVYWEAVGPA